MAVSDWADLIGRASQSSGVPASIISGVMQQESGGNASRIGAAGEIGLMQVMPSTAAQPGYGVSSFNAYTPESNVMGASAYLAGLYNHYGSWDSALSAYNAGSPTSAKGASYASSVLAKAQGYGYTATPAAPGVTTLPDSTITAAKPSTGQGLTFYLVAILLIVILVAGGIWGLIREA